LARRGRPHGGAGGTLRRPTAAMLVAPATALNFGPPGVPLDVSPVCIRQEHGVKVPNYLLPGSEQAALLDDDEADAPRPLFQKPRRDGKPIKRFFADNSCLKSPGQGVLYRNSRQLDDIAPRAGLRWGAFVSGTDAGEGWLHCNNGLYLPKKINGMPVLILSMASTGETAVEMMKRLFSVAPKEDDDSSRQWVTVEATRDNFGECGFSIWPDFMTICTKDKSRPELMDMEEGDLVFAVDGFRVPTFADYSKYAGGVAAFSMTLLRIDNPAAEVEEEDPCVNPQCQNRKCMVGAIFCPACGTRRPLPRPRST